MFIMANVTELLFWSTKLSTALAERSGARVMNEAKEVLIDLSKPGSKARNELRNAFCPKANEPKMSVRYKNNNSSNEIAISFFDGDTPLSSCAYSKGKNRSHSFDLSLRNSQGIEHLNTRGQYNPNEKLFDRDNFGQGFEHRFGYTIGHFDSSGFSIDTKVRDESAISVINKIKGFFKNEI